MITGALATGRATKVRRPRTLLNAENAWRGAKALHGVAARFARRATHGAALRPARVVVVRNAPAQVRVPVTRRGAQDVLHAPAAVRCARGTCARTCNPRSARARATSGASCSRGASGAAARARGASGAAARARAASAGASRSGLVANNRKITGAASTRENEDPSRRQTEPSKSQALIHRRSIAPTHEPGVQPIGGRENAR